MLLSLLVGASSARHCALAQELFSLAPVVVEGSPVLELSPGSFTALSPRDFEGECKDLADLLERVPGLFVVRTAGGGGYAVASIRGSTSSQVAVYLDGVLVSRQGESAFDLSSISLSDVERVEIYRGYIPSRFGFSGLGAVINVVRKERARRAFSLEGRSLGGFRGFGEVGLPLKGGYASLFFEHDESRGDFSYLNDNGTPYNLEDDYRAVRRSNGFRRDSVVARWTRGGSSVLVSASSSRQGLPAAAPGTDRDGIWSGAYLEGRGWEVDLSFPVLSLQFRAFARGRERDFHNPRDFVGWYGQRHSRFEDLVRGASIAFSKTLGRLLLEGSLGFVDEGLRVGGDAVERLGGRDRFDGTRAFCSLEGSLPLDGEGRAFLHWVLRGQALDGDGKLGLGALLSYRLGERALLKLSWGKSSRPPGFYELYGDGASILPNPSLRWEELEEAELGLSLQGPVGVELSLFRRDYDEAIELVQANPRFSVHQNLGAALVEGAELSLSFKLGDVLVEGTYTYMDARSKKAGASWGMRLPNRPQSCGSLRASWSSGRVFLFAEASFTSGWFLDAMERVPYDDLVEVDVGLKLDVGEGRKLFLGAKNLLDERLWMRGDGRRRTPWYPNEGRVLYAGLTVEF